MDAQTLLAAYVLHTRRYGDSSLIAELLTREQGRVVCMVRGALRAGRSGNRVDAFQPLLVELRGRGEVLTLTHSESSSVAPQLHGRNLYCGLYLNELLLRLTARQDACPELFDDYTTAIQALADGLPPEPTLRRFEIRMLSTLGLGMTLEQDSGGQAISIDRSYTYEVDCGAAPTAVGSPGSISGRTLVALQSGTFDDAATLKQARELMRRIIDYHLGGRPLRSRELFR